MPNYRDTHPKERTAQEMMNKNRGRKAGPWLLIGTLLLSPTFLQAAITLQIVFKDTQQLFWERPVSSGAVFSLTHLNSIYDAPVEEAFRVDDRGLIRLMAIRTACAAVLEYYGLEEVSREWISLSRSIGRISLIITHRGAVTFRFENEEIPLSQLLPDGDRVEIRTVSQKSEPAYSHLPFSP